MKKTIMIFVFLLFVLAGCVYLEVHEYFYSNGKTRTLIQIQYQNLVNVLEKTLKTPTGQDWKKFLEENCFNVSNKTNFSYSCHVSKNWLVIEGTRVPSKDFVFSSYNAFPFIVYEIKIFTIPMPPLDAIDLEEKLNLPQNNSFISDPEYLNQLQAAGIKYNYIISVPGEIITHNHGQIISNTLVINPFDVAFSDQKFIYIKSRELNLEHLSYLLIIFLGLLLFFDLVVFWALKEWAKRSDEAEQQRRRELALKERKIFEKKQESNVEFKTIGQNEKI